MEFAQALKPVSSLIELKVISVQTTHPKEKNINVAETWRLPLSKQMENILARMAVLYAGMQWWTKLSRAF